MANNDMTVQTNQITDNLSGQKQLINKQLLPAYIRPVIISNQVTEKATLSAVNNQYVFKVHVLSNKSAVKNAIEQKYNVKVRAVNILNRKGKVTQRGRIAGKTSDWKKAYVTLYKEFFIDFDAKAKIKKD